MKNKSTFLLIILILLSFSCIQKEKKSESDIYSEKSLALISDVLKNEYEICDCLLESPNKPTLKAFEDEIPDFDYAEYILKTFGLNEKSDLEKLHGINEELILNPNSLPSNVKIVYRKEWNEIFSKYGFDARDTIYKRFPNLCFLTKPIFDKDYRTAIMNIDIGGCFWHPPFRLELTEGKWKYD